ncbi:MAG: hypothetical protein QF903_09535 [Planctomycetota bacterium]|nr:hypothetical protein [Planctomycetota bacterium]
MQSSTSPPASSDTAHHAQPDPPRRAARAVLDTGAAIGQDRRGVEGRPRMSEGWW